jgi:hypothetical protein
VKTNHRRCFVAKSPESLRVRHARYAHALGALSGRDVCSKWMGHGSDRQNRRDKAGGKKFVRSRLRFHENSALRRLAAEL